MSILRHRLQARKHIARFLVLVAVGWQAGCAVRTSPAPEPGPAEQPANSNFVELRPGDRVVAVIPILRSGGYILPSLRKQSTTGGDGRVEAGPDFLGYEQDFYTVKRASNGVRVSFRHGVFWRNGKGQPVHAPRVPLFDNTENSRVRLVFLMRVSEADHDMAIVSSADPASLHEITRQVAAEAECRSSRDGTCTWVPNGIAVRLE